MDEIDDTFDFQEKFKHMEAERASMYQQFQDSEIKN